jgi:GST-like protein
MRPGLPAIPVDIGAGDQFAPEFLAISPNNKIPAIVDPRARRRADLDLRVGRDPALPRRQDRPLPAGRPARRYRALEWLMFQMGSVGPMLGQNHHFRLYAPEKIPYAIDRYSNEARRLYGVIDKRLGQATSSPATSTHRRHRDLPVAANWKNQGIELEDYPRLKPWFEGIAARPAVRRGVEVLAGLRKAVRTEKEREMLFGATQYQRR